MSLPAVRTLEELAVLQAGTDAPADALWVVFFWGDFHPPSAPGGQLETLLISLSKVYPTVRFAKAEAEAADELSEHFGIKVIPTFVFLRGKTRLAVLEGADTSALGSLVLKYKDAPPKPLAPESGPTSTSTTSVTTGGEGGGSGSEPPLEDRLRSLISSSKVMVFMKGSPDAPRCGFSRQLVEILKTCPVEFGHFDILSDNEVREGLKKLSNWPTYPQLYVNGTLVGGLDIVKELRDEGELASTLEG